MGVRLTSLELLAVIVGVATVAIVVTSHLSPSPAFVFPHNPWAPPSDGEYAARLRSRYGPSHHSTGPEEWIIRDFFRDQRDGVYVDVGAWHARQSSNTYVLESQLGWSGLAIDADAGLASEWGRLRPRSKFVVAFVDAIDGESRTLYKTGESSVASGAESHVHQFGPTVGTATVISATLNRLISEAGLTRVDFLSMDIEQAEPEALRGFTIARWRPRLVCIEALPATRQPILDYFARAGYVLQGRYLPLDHMNLYFAPIAGETPDSHPFP